MVGTTSCMENPDRVRAYFRQRRRRAVRKFLFGACVFVPGGRDARSGCSSLRGRAVGQYERQYEKLAVGSVEPRPAPPVLPRIAALAGQEATTLLPTALLGFGAVAAGRRRR